MSDPNDPRTVALAYLDAFGRKDFPALEALLAPDVSFRGPAATLNGAREVSTAYRRLGGFIVRNEPRRTFVDGSEVCVIYDCITDTAAGAVPTMEWLTIANGRVRSIVLLTDHVRWPAALEEAKRRAPPTV